MPTNKTTIQRRGRPTTVGAGKPSRTGRALALPLTEKQEAFVYAWMVRRCATKAYADSHPGVTYVTANCEGSKLFRDPRIATYIKRLLSEEAKRLESTYRKVSDTLAAMAFTTIGDVYEKDWSVIAPADLPRDVAVAVKKIRRKEILGGLDGESGGRQVIGYITEVEMHDKIAPLRLLGLELGMFTEKVKHTADDAILAAIKEGRERSLAGS